jgi:Nif-specific regulatory protein
MCAETCAILLRMPDPALPDRFEFVRPLGSGGMSDVFLVRDRASGAPRALKRLRSRGPEAEGLIRNEFARLARIQHDNIVRVFDFGILTDGSPYFTMEFLEGQPLDQAVRPGDLPGALNAMRDALAGLDALHAAGLVHCDLHASNLRVVANPDGSTTTKILDLGLAGRLSDAAGERVRGRPGYVAPEVLDKAPYSRASDDYAIGATLYRVLTGRPAFPGRDPAEILAVQRRGAPAVLPLRASHVPARLETVILQLLSTNPDHRIPAARELAELAARRTSSGPDRGGVDVLRGFGPLIGREDALAELRRELLDSGRPSAAILHGPVGSGRTRLARELAIEAELAGWNVSWLDGANPGPGQSPKPGASSLVVIDDVDTWPEAALEALQPNLAASGQALLFVQSRPPREGDAAYRSLLSLDVPPAPRSVQLGPLDLTAAASFVAQRLGAPIPEDTLRQIAAGVGLMPGALLIELDRWIKSGWLVREGDHWRATEAAPSGAGTSEGSRGEGEALLSSLDPASRIVAFVVASWPAADPVERLARAADIEVTAFERSLENLEWFGLLQREGNARRIVPASLAQALRAGATRPEFAALRPRLRDAFTERSSELGSEGTDHARAWASLVLACHEAALGNADQSREQLLECLVSAVSLDALLADEATQMLLRSAQQGNVEHASQLVRMIGLWTEQGDSVRTVTWWQTARDLLPESEEALEQEWAVRQARHLTNMYQFASAIQILDSLLSEKRARRQGDVLLGQALGLRGWCKVSVGDRDGGVLDLREALHLLPTEDNAERAIALMRLGITLYLADEKEEGGELLEQALAMAQALNDPETEARVHSNRALRYRLDGDLDRADAESRAGLLRLGEESKSRMRFMLITRMLGTAYDRRDWLACIEAQRVLETSSRRSGNPTALSESLNSRVIVGILRGNLSDVVAALRSERPWLKGSEHTEHQQYWRAQSGFALAWIGEEHAAKRRLRRCFVESKTFGLPSPEALAARGLAELALVQGKLRTARRWYRRALERRGSDLATAIPACLGLSRIALQERRLSGIREARAVLDGVHKEGAAPDLMHARVELDAHEMLLEGRTEDAIRLLSDAVAGLRVLDLAPAEILAEWQFARALLTIDPALAHLGFERAHALARRCGIRGWSRRIAEEIAAVKSQTPFVTATPTASGDFLPRTIELLNSLQEYPVLLQRSLDLAAETVGADRGFILLNEDTSGGLKVMAAFGTVDEDSKTNAHEVSRTIVRRVTRSGEAFMTEDVGEDPRLGSTPSLLDMAIRSLLCVPLRIRDRVIGTIYLESRTHSAQFSENDLDLLETFAHLVAVAIENGRLHDELRRSREKVIGENLSLRRDVSRKFARPNIIAQSAQMEAILDEVERVAMSKLSVLITGETGTGKELIAKSIHYASPRADQPFIPVNCAAITRDLIESELFGIVSGAASNVTEHRGFFERADGGTLFLDEIGDMPMELQIKVLRVLETHEFTPVRGTRLIRTDFRLVSATNRDLRELVRQDAFREDLYFRILGHEIELPPLRERKVDIPLLADYFLRGFCEDNGFPLPRMSAEFMAACMDHSWEGNIRDLRNYVERCAVLSRGTILQPVVLPSDLRVEKVPRARAGKSAAKGGGSSEQESSRELRSEMRDHERGMIVQALEKSGWNQRRAAEDLKLSEATLRNKMSRFGIKPPTGFKPKRGRPASSRP